MLQADEGIADIETGALVVAEILPDASHKAVETSSAIHLGEGFNP
jgi:hypothetical protein